VLMVVRLEAENSIALTFDCNIISVQSVKFVLISIYSAFVAL